MLRRLYVRAGTFSATTLPFVSPSDHHRMLKADPRQQTVTVCVAATKGRGRSVRSNCALTGESAAWLRRAARGVPAMQWPSSSLWTATRSAATYTPSFYERKLAFLKEMFENRKKIFAHHELNHERLKYVNKTIGERHKVALTETSAVFALEEYLNSADSQDDLDKYTKRVNVGSILFEDRDFTYEQLLLKCCPDKSSMAPWHGRVPRDVPLGAAVTPSPDVTRAEFAIALFGSSGCGKTEALKAVAEHIIKNHHFPNVVHLSLNWGRVEAEVQEDDVTGKLYDYAETIGYVQPSAAGGPIPSDEEQKEKKEKMSSERNSLVAERLLGAVDSKVTRKIDEEVKRGAPLPDPQKFALVVTMDEIGGVPTLARGLVSISRQLNGDDPQNAPPAVLTLRKVFGHVMIVMAGTTGETMTGGVGRSDPSMVCSVNLDDVHCKNAITGRDLSREEYREALVCAHLPSKTHSPWLAPRLLNSRLRPALDNPRVVFVLAKMTRLVPSSTDDVVLPAADLSIITTIPPSVPETEPTVLPAEIPNPLSLHEFDQWAPLLAADYCKLNGLKYAHPIAADPRAYSERQLAFLRAHYVWDHGAEMRHVLDGLLRKEGKTGQALSEEELGMLDLQRNGLVTFTRDDNPIQAKAVSGSEPRPSYCVSIPPSLPYIALAALDCTAGFGGGGWSAWASVAMQSVGLRYAAAMAWKGSATVGDAVPGLHVAVANNKEDPLAWRVASVGNTGSAWAGRHWCAMVAPIRLCAYAVKKFNHDKGKETFVNNFFGKYRRAPTPKELEVGMKKAKEVFDATQAAKEQTHNAKVGTYWKEKVLPLLKEHCIVLVQNSEKAAPAADCFALIRVDRTSGGKPILVVAQLQMKDFSYSTAPKVDEEMAKMGFVNKSNNSWIEEGAEVTSIRKRARDHLKIMKAEFTKYKLFYGAVICMSRAEPKSTHNWSSLAALQKTRLPNQVSGKGVLYATPVLQRVFYPSDAPADEGKK